MRIAKCKVIRQGLHFSFLNFHSSIAMQPNPPQPVSNVEATVHSPILATHAARSWSVLGDSWHSGPNSSIDLPEICSTYEG